jgi:hypothetical protein
MCSQGGIPMTELLTRAAGVPGAVVTIDPRMVQLVAINLLDEEPEPETTLVDPRRFQLMAIGNLDDEPSPLARLLAV